jgi:uncharacterized SAM-binding protein YcdF (DUF218 family)
MSTAAQRRTQRGGVIGSLISLLFLAILCLAIYFARRPIMRFAAETWVVDQPAQHADAIVVLSGDNFYADRATHAAKLYRQGAAPIVVASGKRLRPNAGEAELVEHDLTERGVPKDKILQLPQDADSTLDESLAVLHLAEQRGWRSLILVTSNYHTRRALYIFQHRLPPTISVSVASAPDGDFDPEHWWEKRVSAKRFFHEFFGMLDSAWELHGSRPAATASS